MSRNHLCLSRLGFLLFGLAIERLVLEDQTPTRADVYAVYPQQLHLSARVRSLIDFLVKRFKNIDHLDEPESTLD